MDSPEPHDLRWLTDQHYLMRQANRKAEEASRTYRARLAFLEGYCRENKYAEGAMRDRINNDWELADAAQSQTFNTMEVQRISAMIAGELAARQLGRWLVTYGQ